MRDTNREGRAMTGDELRSASDLAWAAWADRREKETTWRRDRDGTPGNLARDEFLFREGFRLGAAALGTEQTMHAAWRKRAEEAEAAWLAAHPPDAPDGWRDIGTAPRDGTPVLAWYPKAFRGKGGHYVALWQDGAWWAAVHAFKFEPTHWAPLPAAPAAADPAA